MSDIPPPSDEEFIASCKVGDVVLSACVVTAAPFTPHQRRLCEGGERLVIEAIYENPSGARQFCVCRENDPSYKFLLYAREVSPVPATVPTPPQPPPQPDAQFVPPPPVEDLRAEAMRITRLKMTHARLLAQASCWTQLAAASTAPNGQHRMKCNALDALKVAQAIEQQLDPSSSAVPEFIYVRVSVLPADPERVMLVNKLTEVIGDRPVPDVVPHTDPGAISFDHVCVSAIDEDDAYLQGGRLVPPPPPGAVVNDYVIQLGVSVDLGKLPV